MKRILVYILLICCFACSDEVVLDSEEVVRVKSVENDNWIWGKFYTRQPRKSSYLRALNEAEKDVFRVDVDFVFRNNLVLKELLSEFRGGIFVAIDLRIPPGKDAYYDRADRISYFKNINTRSILHEFFHNFQHRQLNYPEKNELKGMIEFEAYMAMDIIYAIERKNVLGSSEIRLLGVNEGYRNMLDRLAGRGDIDIKAFEKDFSRWAKIWDHPDAKNMEQNFYPELIISILKWYTKFKRGGLL